MLALNTHCYKKASRVVHELVRRSFDTKQDCIWVDETSGVLRFIQAYPYFCPKNLFKT